MEWPHPPMVVPTRKDERYTHKAWSQDAVVLGYDVHGRPWPWPDSVRVMQGIVLGMTGTGKTTLLRNIISQDLMRVVGTPEEPHRIPMVIFDGKGDLEFFYDLLPHIHRAGLQHQHAETPELRNVSEEPLSIIRRQGARAQDPGPPQRVYDIP